MLVARNLNDPRTTRARRSSRASDAVVDKSAPTFVEVLKQFIALIGQIPGEFVLKIVRADQGSYRGRPCFYVFRTILQTAGYMADAAHGAMEQLPGQLEFVDPYTMGLLVKCSAGAADCKQPA